MMFLSASATNTLVAPINFNIVDFIFASVIDLLPTVLELGQLLPLMFSSARSPTAS